MTTTQAPALALGQARPCRHVLAEVARHPKRAHPGGRSTARAARARPMSRPARRSSTKHELVTRRHTYRAERRGRGARAARAGTSTQAYVGTTTLDLDRAGGSGGRRPGHPWPPRYSRWSSQAVVLVEARDDARVPAQQLLRARPLAPKKHGLVAERADVVDLRLDERARELLVDGEPVGARDVAAGRAARASSRRRSSRRPGTAPEPRPPPSSRDRAAARRAGGCRARAGWRR